MAGHARRAKAHRPEATPQRDVAALGSDSLSAIDVDGASSSSLSGDSDWDERGNCPFRASVATRRGTTTAAATPTVAVHAVDSESDCPESAATATAAAALPTVAASPVSGSLPPAAAVSTLSTNGGSAAFPLDTRVPIVPGSPARGWIMRGRLPAVASGLDLAATDGSPLRTMLALRPAELGRVVMFGKLVDTPRYHQSYGRDYVFTGMNHPSQAVPPCVQQLMDYANTQRHRWAPTPDELPAPDAALPLFNSALVNWYMDGNSYIGPHADDERALHPASPIFSFSLGQMRVFRIRDPRHGNVVVRDVELRSGEWLVMGGRMQAEFKHEVVKVAGRKGQLLGPRVNITFRQMKK